MTGDILYMTHKELQNAASLVVTATEAPVWCSAPRLLCRLQQHPGPGHQPAQHTAGRRQQLAVHAAGALAAGLLAGAGALQRQPLHQRLLHRRPQRLLPGQPAVPGRPLPAW